MPKRRSEFWKESDLKAIRVFVRVDSSQVIGTGHVARCATLANALLRAGAQVEFICRAHVGHSANLLESRGLRVHLLPLSDQMAVRREDYATWLGARWEQDAIETADVIAREGGADWLVIDHYGIDAAWENRVQHTSRHTLVVDDLANRKHETNLLLDPNLVAGLSTRYVGKVPTQCGLLLGPRYALLQPEYAELRKKLVRRSSKLTNLLIYFGGADCFDLTLISVEAAVQTLSDDIQINVVADPNSSQWDILTDVLQRRRNCFLHSRLPSLAPLMASANLAIGAGGSTTWERLCLGLPSMVITLADNQREISRYLHEQSFINCLGAATEVSASDIATALHSICNDGLPWESSERCLSVVDGLGAKRVVSAMMATSGLVLQARRVNSDDEPLLLEWANDPVTRQNAFNPDQISQQTHRAWLKRKLCEPETCFLTIVETADGCPIGQVRFERASHHWEVHFALASAFRGKSLGAPMLKAALDSFSAHHSQQMVFGRVKPDNLPSCRVFESLGFTRSMESSDVITYRMKSPLFALKVAE